MTAPDTLAGLLAKYGSPRLAHRDKATLLNVIFADPGWDGFFYREEKPDSCAAYVRVDLIGEAIKILAGAQADETIALRAQAAKDKARNERLSSYLASCIAMIEHAIGPGRDVFIEPDTRRRLSDARAVLEKTK